MSVCLLTDLILPVVTRFARAAGQSSLTNRNPVLFNLTFSKSVLGVSELLISTSGSTAGIASVRVWQQGPAYRAVFGVAVNATGSGSVLVSLLAPGSVEDLAGNALVPSALTAAVNFGTRSLLQCCAFADLSGFPDAVSPAVLSLSRAAGQRALSNRNPVVFNLTLSEVVTGVGNALISTSGSTATVTSLRVWQQGPRQYAVGVNATGAGSIQVSISAAAAAGVRDAAGNALASTAITGSAAFGASSVLAARCVPCVTHCAACVQTPFALWSFL